MNGLLGNDFLDRDVQAKRIAEQRKRALMEGMLQASKLSGRPPRELSEQEMQELLNPPLLPSLQESIESASEDPYTSYIPSQHDMWKSQAHSMSPNYLAQDSESVELPSHHAIHGGGYPIPPPQSAETLSSIHERGFIPFSGESIPFDHPSIAGESIPVTMAMHEQMIPGLHKYFGGGHPDEISLTQAPQHYGYDQFLRQKGLLSDTPPPSPVEQISPTPHTPGGGMLSDKSGWQKDKLFAASEGQLSKDKGWDADRMRLLFDLYKQTQDDEW